MVRRGVVGPLPTACQWGGLCLKMYPHKVDWRWGVLGYFGEGLLGCNRGFESECARRHVGVENLLVCSVKKDGNASGEDSLTGMRGVLHPWGWWISFLLLSSFHRKMEYVPLERVPASSLRSSLHLVTDMRFLEASGRYIIFGISIVSVIPEELMMFNLMIPIPLARTRPLIPLTPILGAGKISPTKRCSKEQMCWVAQLSTPKWIATSSIKAKESCLGFTLTLASTMQSETSQTSIAKQVMVSSDVCGCWEVIGKHVVWSDVTVEMEVGGLSS